MNTTQSANWYALYTKSRAEKKVLLNLEAMGIEAYLPLKRELKKWSDRKKWVETPIISSYIFIKIPESDYQRPFGVNGVVAYVSHKGKASVIPESDILTMKKAIENKMDFSVENDAIEKGQVIKVTSGPLEGVSGEVLDVQGSKKIILRINQIGYTLIINLDDATFQKDE
ncbi:UpxY family transcription antiterminator [Carboxylicivirga sp. M1479]|uniref:UpxY family transcription antiterminator n=1 Tax=Carboxylicivirga sp. M1479 TaxID=2594476 RepID=UPI001178246B|nr:UpxY family transcription antiterminator [Carboxylicivirga sp. M1479]TRX70676.1 UpxY family transcription antiterminator [Carboxylicivirga sp. M1479]